MKTKQKKKLKIMYKTMISLLIDVNVKIKPIFITIISIIYFIEDLFDSLSDTSLSEQQDKPTNDKQDHDPNPTVEMTSNLKDSSSKFPSLTRLSERLSTHLSRISLKKQKVQFVDEHGISP